MSKRVRHQVRGVSQAAAPRAVRIRTRLEVSERDLRVVTALTAHQSRLCGVDLADRCRAGVDPDRSEWADRKRVLTRESSSRWAGAITKSSNQSYALARRNQERQLRELTAAIAQIEAKLALPVHSDRQRRELRAGEAEHARAEGRDRRRLGFGYRSQHEHAMKGQRLQVLRARRAKVAADHEKGIVHICRGGKELLRQRLHLQEAGLSEAEWRAAWVARRERAQANGESGKGFGNETIRVRPEGILEVDLPPSLASLANLTVRGTTRYRFDAVVSFPHQAAAWRRQVSAHRAVAYEISHHPGRERVYLDASFELTEVAAVPELATLREDPRLRLLAVDLNHGFVAAQVVERDGNPVGHQGQIRLQTEDLPSSVRDGHLRQAVSELIELAGSWGCRGLVVEELGFEEMRALGRERYGAMGWFRKVVCGLPTSRFRWRLVSMASRAGLAVLGVPAAYSSRWGAEHWQESMPAGAGAGRRHVAAAVVLGRRALGHSARRRGGRCQPRRGRAWYSTDVRMPARP